MILNPFTKANESSPSPGFRMIYNYLDYNNNSMTLNRNCIVAFLYEDGDTNTFVPGAFRLGASGDIVLGGIAINGSSGSFVIRILGSRYATISQLISN